MNTQLISAIGIIQNLFHLKLPFSSTMNSTDTQRSNKIIVAIGMTDKSRKEKLIKQAKRTFMGLSTGVVMP